MTKYRDCVVCGEQFEVVYRQNTNAKTCGLECAKQHRGKYLRAWKRDSYADNPEPWKSHQSEWAKSHRPSINATKRASYAADPEKVLAPRRARYAANREAINARCRELYRMKREGAGHDGA